MPGLTLGSFVSMAKQRFTSYDVVDTSFDGKTVLITGANAGIGLDVAHEIALLGADRIVLAVRSIEKGKTAAAQIETRANKKGLCQVMELDMANMDSVIAFASRLEKEAPLLDTVILNAGVREKEYRKSVHGWEMDVQVNAISTTLLALLLLPQLRKSSEQRSAQVGGPSPSRLTIVTSSNHATVVRSELPSGNAPLLETISNTPNDAKAFDAQLQYAKSKLAIMWMMSRLARVGAGDDVAHAAVIVNSVCPGATRSTLARGMDSMAERVMVNTFQSIFMKPTKVGAEIVVKGATLDVGGVGAFWYENQIYPPSSLVVGDEGKVLSTRAWEETIDILRVKVPHLEELKGISPLPAATSVSHWTRRFCVLKAKKKHSSLERQACKDRDQHLMESEIDK